MRDLTMSQRVRVAPLAAVQLLLAAVSYGAAVRIFERQPASASVIAAVALIGATTATVLLVWSLIRVKWLPSAGTRIVAGLVLILFTLSQWLL